MRVLESAAPAAAAEEGAAEPGGSPGGASACRPLPATLDCSPEAQLPPSAVNADAESLQPMATLLQAAVGVGGCCAAAPLRPSMCGRESGEPSPRRPTEEATGGTRSSGSLPSWYMTSLMPAWMRSLAHSPQGNSVTYTFCAEEQQVVVRGVISSRRRGGEGRHQLQVADRLGMSWGHEQQAGGHEQ